MPPLMSNKRNYIVSLGDVVRWLASQGRGDWASKSIPAFLAPKS